MANEIELSEMDDSDGKTLLANAIFLNGGLPLKAIDPSKRPAEWKNYTSQYTAPVAPWPDGLEPPVVQGVALFVEEVDG